ncbi:MAG: ABC transporter substrate-binding protein [Burkholderiales bacterium]|nr:ABC transporter substrate-binding protein [Anaerolineae bacterium]
MRHTRVIVWVLVVMLALVTGSFATAQDPVEITLQGWSSNPTEDAALQAAVDAFMEANPNIDVTIQYSPDHATTMQAAFAATSDNVKPPEVFFVNSDKFSDWASAGVLAPAEENIEDVEGIFPSLLNVFTYQGTLYCPPKDFSTLALLYNRDLFDAAGVEYPTADWTWDDLRAASEALTTTNDAGEQVVGVVLPAELPRWLPFLYQAGGAPFSEDMSATTINSPEAQEALDFYVNLRLDGFGAEPSAVDSGWGGEAFGNQRAAMALEGNWAISFLNETYPDLNWGIAELPAGSGGEGTMAFTVCLGVAADNDHLEESWALVNWLTGPEGAMTVAEEGFGPMPARMDAAERWIEVRGEDYQPFVAGAENAFPWVLPPGFQEFADNFNSSIQQAFDGQLFPEDVLTSSEEVANEIYAR